MWDLVAIDNDDDDQAHIEAPHLIYLGQCPASIHQQQQRSGGMVGMVCNEAIYQRMIESAWTDIKRPRSRPIARYLEFVGPSTVLKSLNSKVKTMISTLF